MRVWHHPYRSIYLGAMVGAVAGLLFTWFMLPRTYASNATLVFPLPSGGDNLLAGMRDASLGRFSTPTGDVFPLSTYEAVLNSRELSRQVAQRLDLGKLYHINNPELLGQQASSWLSARVNVADRTLTVEAVLPGTPRVRGLRDILKRSTSNARDSIYREKAAACCVEMISQMSQMADEIKLDRSKARVQDLERELARAKAKLEPMLQDAVASGWQSDGMVTALGEQLGEKLSVVDQTRLQVKADLNAVERRIATIRKQLAQNLEDVDSLPAELRFLQQAREAARQAKDEYQRLSKIYGDENQAVARARSELQQRRETLQSQMRTASRGLTEDLQQLEATRSELTARLATFSKEGTQIQSRLSQVPEALLQATKAQQVVEVQTKLVSTLEQQLLTARMEYEQRGIKWTVLDPPVVPLKKSSPSTMKNIILGLMFGSLLLGRKSWQRWLVDTVERTSGKKDS